MWASRCPTPSRCQELAWLPPDIIRLAVAQFIFICVAGMVVLYVHWPPESPELIALAIVHGLVNVAGSIACWSPVPVRAMWAFQVLVLVVFCTNAVTLNLIAGYSELSLVSRGYVMGGADVLVKLLAGSLMPRPVYLPFLLFATASAATSTYFVGEWYDQPAEAAQYILIATTSIIAYFHARAAQVWPAAVRDVRGQLSREEDTVESLLPMLSDGTCWLASDGDSIAHCDDQFQALIGRRTGRRRLSDCAQEERQQLQSALADLAAAPRAAEPQALQATLGTKRGRGQRVELIVVDRRREQKPDADDGASPEQPAFLLGVVRAAKKPERTLGPRVEEDVDTSYSPPPGSDASTRSLSAVAASVSSGSGSTASSLTSALPRPSAAARPGALAAPPVCQAPAPLGRAPARPAPAPKASAPAPNASAPARPVPAPEPSARLPELRELAVEFDALSPQFKVRSCTLHFAREAPGLQLPDLMNFLQAPQAAAFQTWAQERANSAFSAGGESTETTLPVPGSCQIVFSVPSLGMKLVGGTAELHIAPDEEPEEPEVLATLRLRDLTQLQQRRRRMTRSATRGSGSNLRMRTIDERRMHSGTTPESSLDQMKK